VEEEEKISSFEKSRRSSMGKLQSAVLVTPYTSISHCNYGSNWVSLCFWLCASSSHTSRGFERARERERVGVFEEDRDIVFDGKGTGGQRNVQGVIMQCSALQSADREREREKAFFFFC
jgi:hypothetical protein